MLASVVRHLSPRFPTLPALTALTLLSWATACAPGSGGDGVPDAGKQCFPSEKHTFGGARPVELLVPSTYDACEPAGLLILLHGLGATGELQRQFFGLDRLADEGGWLAIAPEGTKGDDGQFWNGTDVCCDFDRTGVDDSTYLTGLVDEIAAEFNVDRKRVYLVGHSNGGFMSYRLACDHADTFAALVSVAGATFLKAEDCAPSEPVSVLQIHGTADDIVFYTGEKIGSYEYPSAEKTVTRWGAYDGCTGGLESVDGKLDLDISQPVEGAPEEASRQRIAGCPAGIDVELWSMENAGHIPPFGAGFRVAVRDWLTAHPKTK